MKRGIVIALMFFAFGWFGHEMRDDLCPDPAHDHDQHHEMTLAKLDLWKVAIPALGGPVLLWFFRRKKS